MKKNIGLYIKILLLAWFGIFTFVNANAQSLWADELSSIGFIRTGLSLKEMFSIYLHYDTNLPLYSFILYFWYRIVPYGEQFLLIPSILFCIGGIIFLAETAKSIKGERMHLLVVLIGCSSNAVIWQGAWEVRCYSLVFFLSAFAMWSYIRKTLNPCTKNLLIYGISVILFLWTHWFACILLAFYGLSDLFMIIRKKSSWKVLLCYPVALLTYCPWLYVSLFTKQNLIADFWPDIPRFSNMAWTILFFLSGRRVLWYICLITGAALCVKSVINFFKRNSQTDSALCLGCIFTLSIYWVIGIVFLYSAYINPKGSLYVERYFMVIAPHILIITAWGIDFIMNILGKIIPDPGKHLPAVSFLPRMTQIIAVIGLCIYWVLCYKESYSTIHKPNQEYREVSDYLIQENKLGDGRTLLAGSNKACILDGFIDYYFIKRDYAEPSSVIDYRDIQDREDSRFYSNYTQYSKDDLLQYDLIYCLKIHMSYSDEFADFLNENYIPVSADNLSGLEMWQKKE